jgi:hypothetical protein
MKPTLMIGYQVQAHSPPLDSTVISEGIDSGDDDGKPVHKGCTVIIIHGSAAVTCICPTVS